MRSTLYLFLRILLCLTLAISAFIYATALIESLFAYRSLLKDHAPAPGRPLLVNADECISRRVVIVLIDALRLDTSLKPDIMPNLNRLRQHAASATMHSRPPSYSEPGYTTLFTGAWPDINDGPPINLDYEDIPTWTQDNLFSAAHRAGLKTAISGYYWFEKLVPQGAVSLSFYTPGEDQFADRQVVDAALPWLRDDNIHLFLIHLDQVDYAGHHEGGPRDQRWDQSARRADDLLAEIVAELDLSKDTLLVVSDHGQIERGGHGGHESVVLTEPFVLVGAGVKPGDYGDVDMVDVAPTLAALLGVNIPATSQGRVRTEMLTLPADTVAALPGILHEQQSQLLQAYLAAIERRSEPEKSDDIVGVFQKALESARASRLREERLLRGVIALAAAFIPFIWLARKPRRELIWLIAGATIYIVTFNIIYAVIAGRTYSLSSVASPDELILFCALTVGAALLLSWVIFSFGLHILNQPAIHGAKLELDLTLTTIYLVSLPLLWGFTINGALVSWILPHFPSLFLGFLASIQVLIISVIGLILVGLTALLHWLESRIITSKLRADSS